jgi:hypothetical protein
VKHWLRRNRASDATGCPDAPPKATRSTGVACYRATLLCCAASACSTDPDPSFDQPPLNPAFASVIEVDRFSPDAGVLRVRNADNGLPEAGEPIDFDTLFLFQGFGPDGQHIRYYDLDIHSQVPSRLYTFSSAGEPLVDQLPVLSHVPGEPGYNDFVRVFDVSVPRGYRANSIRSEADLMQARFLVTPTDRIINRPVVPDGSIAQLRYRGPSDISYGWHSGQLAPSFTFEGQVPSQDIGFGERAVNISTIYVSFKVNPDLEGGGPASGPRMEPDGKQTHNVVEAIPGDPLYSPLWMVIIYDNSAFDSVMDDESAEAAPVVARVTSPLIDCPVVEVEAE